MKDRGGHDPHRDWTRHDGLHGDAVEALARAVLARVADRAGVLPDAPSPEFLESFCTLLVSGDAVAAGNLLRARTARRQSYAQVADGILGSAARLLGRKWDSDALSFAEVSVAITQILRLNQAYARRPVPVTRAGAPRVGVFAALPGQAHSLGVVLAAEAFRQSGWQIELLLNRPERDVVEAIRRLRPEVVGLTVSVEDRPGRLSPLVHALNRLPYRVPVLLGGTGAATVAPALPTGQHVRVVTDIVSALNAV